MHLSFDQFSRINLDDPFFNSLKSDYQEFSNWFMRKANEYAYVSRKEDSSIDGFLYLKCETAALTDIDPGRTAALRLKIGTFKIEPHGTRLGERFIKKVFDEAIEAGVQEIYVTVFEKHAVLIDLFSKYGFKKEAIKQTSNGEESVFVRDFTPNSDSVVKDYPFCKTQGQKYALLSIYPEFHTRLFPDSKLNNEAIEIIKDISHSNSIHKVYLCGMADVLNLKNGDLLLIYRTKDNRSAAPAHYTSVVTSLCVVEETRHLSSFSSEDEFLSYTRPYSIFSEQELNKLWKTRKYPNIIRFTYNAAFRHRLTRAELLDQVGLPADGYFGFLRVTLDQLRHILKLGNINEGIIID